MSGSKLFLEVNSRKQKSLLARKELMSHSVTNTTKLEELELSENLTLAPLQRFSCSKKAKF